MSTLELKVKEDNLYYAYSYSLIDFETYLEELVKLFTGIEAI